MLDILDGNKLAENFAQIISDSIEVNGENNTGRFNQETFRALMEPFLFGKGDDDIRQKFLTEENQNNLNELNIFLEGKVRELGQEVDIAYSQGKISNPGFYNKTLKPLMKAIFQSISAFIMSAPLISYAMGSSLSAPIAVAGFVVGASALASQYESPKAYEKKFDKIIEDFDKDLVKILAREKEFKLSKPIGRLAHPEVYDEHIGTHLRKELKKRIGNNPSKGRGSV